MSKVRRSDVGLAVDIPEAVVERLGIREGDEVNVYRDPAGALLIVPDLSVSHGTNDPEERARLLQELRTDRGQTPADHRFNRDETNER